MKSTIMAALAVATFAVSDAAYADDNLHPYHPDVSVATPHPFRIGFGADVGVPSGAQVGVVVNPFIDWARVEVSLGYNYLSFGGRASLQLDPMALLPNLPVGLFADVQAGFFPTSAVPGHSDLPKVGYDYLNLYGGLRLGKPNGFHWNLEVGPTYMHANTSNFQSILSKTGSSGLTVGNPSANIWLVPTFVTGFTVVF